MIEGEGGMCYFTDNEAYATPQKTMEKWRKENGDLKIIYK